MSEYLDLAAQILGRDTAHAPLGLPGWEPPDRRQYPGDVSDEDEQELAARVCELLPVMTLGEWKSLDEDQRLPWLRRAAGHLDASGDSDAFVPVSLVWQDKFPSYARAKKFLDKHPEIQTDKPSEQRLTVHAGDWIRFWAGLTAEPTDEQIEAFIAAKEERQAQLKRK